ncbi:hypothetical protein ACFXG4_30325 [Nocardia sp. NPDC059246]
MAGAGHSLPATHPGEAADCLVEVIDALTDIAADPASPEGAPTS